MKSHDPEKLVKSEVFKAINHMIDEKVEQYKANCDFVTGLVKSVKPGTLRVRVSYEGKEEIPVPFTVHEILRIKSVLNEIENAALEINKLQVFKLELLNDYDFTHGDLSVQQAIFGKAK